MKVSAISATDPKISLILFALVFRPLSYGYKKTIFIGDGTARSAADGDDVDADGQGTRAGATATADEGTLTGKGREPAATMMTA